MTRVVFVRHGESLWNVERRIQGQSGPGLTARGHAQAEASAAWVAEGFPDAHVVTSDLERCRDTVAPFERLLGRPAVVDVAVRERAFGDWTGLLAQEIATRDPERWDRWRKAEDVVAEVGGEDTPTLVGRVVGAVEHHATRIAEDDGDTLVVVTHGGPVWHGTTGLLGLSPSVLGGVHNASITELTRSEHGWRLVSWNQTGHLPLDLRVSPRAADVPAHLRPPPVGT